MTTMTSKVAQIADQVKGLADEERAEFLSWLAEYELGHTDEWDREIARDSQPGGRLDSVIRRARKDIAQGKTKPLDEVLNNT
jgi:hypothetical protein